MSLTRREFVAGAAALGISARSAFAGGRQQDPSASRRSVLREGGLSPIFPASVRADFPIASLETYMNSAALHPLGTFASRAVEQTMAYRQRGPGEGRSDFGIDKQNDLKQRFGQLIGAKPTEVAFVSSTSDGENIVVMGLDLAKKRPSTTLGASGRPNVVIDELHFTSSLYMYRELEKQGIELRIVKHRDWEISVADMDRAIDKNTRLVSLALVSNVNGYLHDCKSVAEIAHARGAYVFADIIQAAGALYLDMRGLGIDFASTGTYKWLMGERGFGFLYVRQEHQATVLPTTRYGHRQVTNFNREKLTWEPLPGAAMYETGNIPVLLAAAVSAGIDYVLALGIDKIRTHANQLIARLQNELPPLGYKSLTPRHIESPTVAFALKDAAATAKALQAAKVTATIVANESRLRLSVSVFNNHDDIDRVVAALGRRPSV